MGRPRKDNDREMIIDGDISILLPKDGCLLSTSCFTCSIPDSCAYDEYREKVYRKEMLFKKGK